MLCFSFLMDKNQPLYQIKGSRQNVMKQKALWSFWLLFPGFWLPTSLNRPKWEFSRGRLQTFSEDFPFLTGRSFTDKHRERVKRSSFGQKSV